MNEWKPEKNVSSPWDADVWENNIGQPVKPSGDNLPYPYTTSYIQPQGTLHIYSKWYDVDTTKITSIKDVQALFSAIGLKVSETIENFDEVKHLLDIPEKPKTLDEISQELDEKIDKLIEKTKRNSYASKLTAERNYEYKFDKIFENFEYAKEHGTFPHKLSFTVGNGLSVNNSYITSNFVIKSDTIGVGYWEIKPNVQMWLKQKPNWLVRKCAKIFFDFTWKDG